MRKVAINHLRGVFKGGHRSQPRFSSKALTNQSKSWELSIVGLFAGSGDVSMLDMLLAAASTEATEQHIKGQRTATTPPRMRHVSTSCSKHHRVLPHT